MERHSVAYGYSTIVGLSQAEALEATRAALANEGFGILCEIDVEATLRARIGADVGPYVILGACNPSLAYAAIGIDRDIGLLLPCNVVVHAATEPGRTVVSVIDPERVIALAEAHGLLPIAGDASARLLRVLRAVENVVPVASPPSLTITDTSADVAEEIC